MLTQNTGQRSISCAEVHHPRAPRTRADERGFPTVEAEPLLRLAGLAQTFEQLGRGGGRPLAVDGLPLLSHVRMLADSPLPGATRVRGHGGRLLAAPAR